MKNRKNLMLAALAAAALTFAACTPTKTAPTTAAEVHSEAHEHPRPETTPDGKPVETIDGAADKLNMVVTEDASVMVCIYTVNDAKDGLKQNMDGIEGEELDPQDLIDMMAEYKVIPEGALVESFDNADGALTLKLSGISIGEDDLALPAIINTFTMNYEADSLTLVADGNTLCEGASFIKDFKKIK